MRPRRVTCAALALAVCFAQQLTAQRSQGSPKTVPTGEPWSRVDPIYPPSAKAAGVQGTVVLKVNISESGVVQKVKLVSGHPLLVSAAIDAVKRWKFKPYLSNGSPMKVETIVRVNFTLDQGGWIFNFAQTPLEISSDGERSYLLSNKANVPVTKVRLGCVVSREGSLVIVHRMVPEEATIAPSEGWVSLAFHQNPDRIACERRSAKLAVIEVDFEDGTQWRPTANVQED